MPIYAYKCGSCGHAKDVLQKVSDAPLTTCPACAAESFSKQITAAGFQLKGSGWYATDFRNGSAAPAAPASDAGNSGNAKSGDAKPAEKSADKSSDAKPSEGSGAAKTETPAASGGCGSACACH